MAKIYLGTIHGNTIQLDDPSGFSDGQRVAVVLTSSFPDAEWKRRVGELAGALSELPASVDEDLRIVLAGRNEPQREFGQ